MSARGDAAVVIGAGVVGSAIAMELARTGRPTCIVDRAAGAGMGSTAASSAVVRYNYSTDAGTAMAYESLHSWRRWSELVALGPGVMLARFVECGMVLIDSAEGMAAPTLGPLARAGVPHEVWDGEELARRLPALDPSRLGPPRRVTDPTFWNDASELVATAVWTPTAGYVTDPQLAAQNLHDAALEAGAVARFGATVVGIETAKGAVTGVALADGSTIEARVVVNAAGPHAPQINELAGVLHDMTVTTRPLRQQVDYTPTTMASAPVLDNLPVVGDLDAGTYFRGDSAGVLVGGVEAPCDPLIWLDDPDAVDPSLDAEEWETKTLRLARRVPELGVPLERRGVVGVYDVSDDWIPVLDRSGLDGYYLACGTSGNQFKNAPTIGQAMTELIDAVSSGHDHDADPLVVRGRHTGLAIDMGTFSRRRDTSSGSGTVLG